MQVWCSALQEGCIVYAPETEDRNLVYVCDICVFWNVGSVAQCGGTSPRVVGRFFRILEMFLKTNSKLLKANR
jgi:hypothetical protein